MTNPKNKKMKISALGISKYFLIAVVTTAILIILFQFTKVVYTEDTLLWGFIPWSDSYFMFALLFVIFPTTIFMILYLIKRKVK